LLGKTISAFLPTIAATYGSAAIFMGLIDELTFRKLDYFYFPNWGTGALLLILIPITIILSVEFSVIVSARANPQGGDTNKMEVNNWCLS
jgi:hypothetical protein